MTITKQTALNEILIRLADDGSVAGAHVVEIEHLTDTATGEIISSRLLPARGVAAAEVGGILGAANAGLLEQIDQLRADVAALTAERDELKAKVGAMPDPATADPETTFAAAIQAHIDATARARGYADGVAVVSYKFSTVPAWAAEAAAFVEWRDAVWVYAYQQLAAVQTGARDMPDVATIIGELPAIGWPEG
jgi:diadenosine tetraphosphatase ApaH/serine/threonine PP2A family protein phosphatase